MDLVTHTLGVDHHPGIVANHHTGDGDFACAPVHCDISHPGCPGRAEAGEFTVDIARIGKTPAAQHITFGLCLHGPGMWLPLRAFSGGFDQVDGARVGQVLEAIFDRVDASGEGQLINVRLMGEAVGHGRHPPHP
ncbi:hypothetical protein D9M71_419370 [compost metagenome]